MNHNSASLSVATASVETLTEENGKPESSPLPKHLFRLPGGPWAVWRWVALRGAGFAARQVLELASPECAAAADQLARLEQEARWTKDAALKRINNTLDALRSTSDWDEDERRTPLLKAMRRLKSGKLATQTGVDAAVDAAIEA